MPMKKTNGFTLIELMIVVAVIAILMAIALPSYAAYVTRANRGNAKAALLKASQWMERVATAQGSYPTVTEFGSTGLAVVEGNRYTVSLQLPATGGYLLTATRQGASATDACGNFTLTQAGVRNVTGTLSVTDCWGR